MEVSVMKELQAGSCVLGTAVGLVLLLRAPAALAFVEDICFPPGGGAPYNCAPLPPECQPVGSTSPACLTAALAKLGGAYRTAKMDGFNRTGFTVGGAFYHYVPIYNGGSATPPPGIDGLHPDVHAAGTEYFLVHVRNWAMAGGGAAPPICTAGRAAADRGVELGRERGGAEGPRAPARVRGAHAARSEPSDPW
jgi:hypothetical protein